MSWTVVLRLVFSQVVLHEPESALHTTGTFLSLQFLTYVEFAFVFMTSSSPWLQTCICLVSTALVLYLQYIGMNMALRY